MTLTTTDWPRIIADPSIAEVYNTETRTVYQIAHVGAELGGYSVRLKGWTSRMWFNGSDMSDGTPYAIRLRTLEPVEDNRVCVICDGGPGNECACSCGMQKWEPVAPAEIPEWTGTVQGKLVDEERKLQPHLTPKQAVHHAFRRLIAKHEKEPEPVDPDLELARAFVEKWRNGTEGSWETRMTEDAVDLIKAGRAELAKRGLDVGRVKP